MSPRDTKSLNSGNFNEEELYIALSDINLDWLQDQVAEFIRLWQEEYSLLQIAQFFKRHPFECFLLYTDLAFKDKVKPREEGPWSERYNPKRPRKEKIRIETDEPAPEQKAAGGTIPHHLMQAPIKPEQVPPLPRGGA